MAEARASSTDESSRKLRAVWKAGEKFPINFVPSVEGMVAATKWRDGVFSVIFVSPPYERQGGSWADAAITYRTTTALVKKPLPSYDYPFPADPRILQEIVKANGNMEMLQEVVNYINKIRVPIKQPVENPLTSTGWENEDKIVSESATAGSSQPPLPSTVVEDAQISAANMLTGDFMDKFIAAFSSRLSVKQAMATNQALPGPLELPQGLDMEQGQSREFQDLAAASSSLSNNSKEDLSSKRNKQKKKKQRSSSSSSSSFSSRSSSSDSNVGHGREKGGSGWFSCPFSPLDSRQVTLPRNVMKGKHEERKMLRQVLHSLYSNFTNLRCFVDTLKVDTTTSSFKPFSNDLIWLAHHATYLDSLLLHTTDGSWKLWNELGIDFIARSFLELVVRASPTRKYPELIDEKVRRWMKRKRIGVSSQYGAIPTYLSEAKITEDGVQPKGGWVPFQKRENRTMPFQQQYAKPKTIPSQGGEKKT